MIEYVFPKRIIEEKKIKNAKGLLKEKALQIGLNEKNLAVTTKGGSVILDFGLEMNGGVRILTFNSDKSPVRIRFGESITECCENVGGERNATNDHAMRDYCITLPDYSDQTYGNTGFRFVRLDFNGDLKIKSVVAQNNILVKKPIWVYGGADGDIRSIFNTAKRTIDLCASSEYVWDGVKRDRLVWYGDLHPEMLALTTLYGRTKQIENSINLARKEYPLPAWLNNFPSYSMWWMVIVSDYYFMTKCTGFTKKQLPYLTKLIEQMESFVAEDGTMNYPYYFVDWPTFETKYAVEGVRALNILAVKRAIKLLKEFDLPTSSAEKLLEKLLKKSIDRGDKKSIIALKCLALDEVCDEDYAKLISGGAEGISTFMSYYVLKAIALRDEDKAISIMKDYFMKMLSLGATTFWEDFDVRWTENAFAIDGKAVEGKSDIHGDRGAYCYKGFRHSLCHGWSTGVLAFIKEYC